MTRRSRQRLSDATKRSVKDRARSRLSTKRLLRPKHTSLFGGSPNSTPRVMRTFSALAKKYARWSEILQSDAYLHQKLTADAWCAAFVWPKRPGELANAAPTQARWQLLRDGHPVETITTTTVTTLTEQYGFFHWHLQFPRIFAKGGFDVVLGNPPWDKIQPEEEKFFASFRSDIAMAPSANVRKALIAGLPTDAPGDQARWTRYKRTIEGTCQLLGDSGAFVYTGSGNLNSFRIFAELGVRIVSPDGRVGLIVQTGLATDESGKEFFEWLLSSGRLTRFLDFENRKGFFPDIHSQMRFCLLTLRGQQTHGPGSGAEFGWLLHTLEEMRIPDRLVVLTASDVQNFNPNSRTAPVLMSGRDLRIAKQIYSTHPHIAVDGHHRYAQIDFLGELFNLTRDSGLFDAASSPEHLCLYEAKFIHQFDHRFATLDPHSSMVREATDQEKGDADRLVVPKNYVLASHVRERCRRRGITSAWMCGFRDVTNAMNERTAIASVLPLAAIGNSINLILGLSPKEAGLLVANVNSFVFDYCARQKMSARHLNIWIFKQLPAVSSDTYALPTPWAPHVPVSSWCLPRILELTYTAWDLEPFAQGLGYGGPPFRWDRARRFLLRCELDAAFFHLYGLSRQDVDHVMNTFSLVRQRDEQTHGRYRTKDTILEIYDAMHEAAMAGRACQAALTPAPADSSVAHPARVKLPEIPAMPSVLPTLSAGQDVAILIWAILHASDGTIRRSDLARAFALRNRPELLTRLAPAAVRTIATQWMKARGTAMTTGTLAGVLTDLAARSGVDIAVDTDGRSLVRLNANTPALDRIEDWYRFEASLVVHVLKSLLATNVAAIDAAVTGDDRALLAS